MGIEVKRFLPNLRRTGQNIDQPQAQVTGEPISPLKDPLPDIPSGRERTLPEEMIRYDEAFTRRNTID